MRHGARRVLSSRERQARRYGMRALESGKRDDIHVGVSVPASKTRCTGLFIQARQKPETVSTCSSAVDSEQNQTESDDAANC